MACRPSCAQVFTDARGVIYAVKPPQPLGDDWQLKVKYLSRKLQELHEELSLVAKENVDHSRGNFDRFSCGTAHGGGRVVRGFDSLPLLAHLANSGRP